MQKKINVTLRQQQAGFRAGRSCVDHIVTLRIILEQINETQVSLYLVFIDYEKAFDRLNHGNMWEALRRNGLSEKIIGLIEAQYSAEWEALRRNGLSEKIIGLIEAQYSAEYFTTVFCPIPSGSLLE